MKKLTQILSCAILFMTTTLQAATFYVAKTGNDNNTGSFSKPFKTIQKAADSMQPGDICYIKEGTYRETVNIKTDGLSFEAFNNNFVVVSGADLVGSWTKHSGNIYKANFLNPEPEFTQVFFQGKHQRIARYPDLENDDLLTIDDGYALCEVKANGKVQFNNTLPGKTDHWKGGYFRAISGLTWMNPMGKIEQSSGKNLTCNMISKEWEAASRACIGPGTGYILHLNALSTPGEWYHQDGVLYYWKPGGGKPTNTEVEAQKRAFAFRINGRNNIVLKHLHIKAASIELKNSNNCTLQQCSFRYQKGFFTRPQYHWSYTQLGGIYINGSNNTIDQCYFNGSWGNLLNLEGGKDNVITNSIFENNGWISMFTSCVQNNSYNLKVEHNTFGSTGRFHIRTDVKTDIRYNDFYDCMKVGQDAGSIEITNGGQAGQTYHLDGAEIAYNKFHDMNTTQSFINKKNFVVALYLEGADDYTAHHNLAYNIKTENTQGSFMYLGPRYCHIKNIKYYNNTVWDVDKIMGYWNRDGLGKITNLQFKNNIFDARGEISYGTPSLKDGMTFQKNLINSDTNEMFKNASKGNFELQEYSPAIDYGTIILGYTNGYNGSAPDAGCYEYGTPKWSCGSWISRPSFPDEGDVSVENITLNNTTITLNSLDETFQLLATVLPQNASNKSVTWSSSDNNIVSVTNGLISAKKSGVAIVKVKSDNSSHYSTCTVNVNITPYEEIIINPSLETGTTYPWTGFGSKKVITSSTHGKYGIQITGQGSLAQTISVKPNTTYTLSVDAKVQNQGTVVLGVKEYGGTDITSTITDNTYTTASVTFTTGLNNTSARIYLHVPNANDIAYGDNFKIHSEISSTILKNSTYSNSNINEELLRLTIFPNPVTNGLMHCDVNGINEKTTLQLFNTLGTIIETYNLDSNQKISINVSHLNTGMYYLKLSNTAPSIVQKFIIE